MTINANTNYTFNIDITSTIPSGYKAMAVIGYSFNDSVVNIWSMSLGSNNVANVAVRNIYSAPITVVCTAIVLCIRDN